MTEQGGAKRQEATPAGAQKTAWRGGARGTTTSAPQAGTPLLPEAQLLLSLQHGAGNHAVNRVLRQRRDEAEPERENRTGMPDALKSSVESLSGVGLDDVRVHYGSSQPAQLGALAYAKGSEIHVGPGHERHVPHEAWHVVQQAQGRVQQTTQLKRDAAASDDAGLEREADVMGARALAQSGEAAPRPMSRLRGLAAHALGRAPRAERPVSFGSVLQAKTPPASDYTNAEKRAAIAEAQKEGKKGQKPGAAAALMAAYLIKLDPPMSTKYKSTAALEKACTEWWNKPSMVDEPKVVQVRGALVGPTLEYDAKHGDYHFINKATQSKSAWTMEKAAANQLCETTINKHLKALGERSALHENRDGWCSFYISAAHTKPLGTYYVQGERNHPSTDHFSIQLQVNYAENLVSYHGFPDERVVGQPLGCSYQKTDKQKLT